MTPHEQRIAIAEACGYKDLETQWENYHEWQCPDGRVRMGTLSDKYACLPDYLKDLNAMHEAEKVLNVEQESCYWGHLLAAHEYIQPWAGCATAAQRAEAFLRTLNLWKE